MEPNHRFVCGHCGRAASAYRSPSNKAPRFCSAECHNKAQRGSGNPSFTGGCHLGRNGYVFVLAPTHPQADVRGYVYEHRLVMEAELGRPLSDSEVIHHIDGDKTNNAPSNLRLYATHSEHIRAEHNIQKVVRSWAY